MANIPKITDVFGDRIDRDFVERVIIKNLNDSGKTNKELYFNIQKDGCFLYTEQLARITLQMFKSNKIRGLKQGNKNVWYL